MPLATEERRLAQIGQNAVQEFIAKTVATASQSHRLATGHGWGNRNDEPVIIRIQTTYGVVNLS